MRARSPDAGASDGAVAFRPESRTIVVAEQNGPVRRYECALCGDLDDLLDLAHQRLRRSGLTLAEADEQRGTTRGA